MKIKLIHCIALGATLTLSGCAATDRQATEGESTAAGALLGGLIGGLIGDNKKGVAIGAALGAMIGNAYGKHIADKKEEYANNEDYMNAVIAEADKVLAATQEHRTILETVITERKNELARLGENSQKTTIENKEFETKLAQVKEQTEKLKTIIAREITVQEKTLEQERNVIPAALITQSESKIDKLKNEQKKLKNLEFNLANLDEKRVY